MAGNETLCNVAAAWRCSMEQNDREPPVPRRSRRTRAREMDDAHELVDCAALYRMALAGVDLVPRAQRLLERAQRNVEAADALMELSWIFVHLGSPEMAETAQSAAVGLQRYYRLPPPTGHVGLRLLALVPEGDYGARTPLEFLLEGSDVELGLQFVGPSLPWPDTLPAHDVLFNAVNECDEHRALLGQIDERLSRLGCSAIDAPSRVPLVARDRASTLLEFVPGVEMPLTVRVGRAALEAAVRGDAAITSIVHAGYPLIVRAVGAHRGKDMMRADVATELAAALDAIPSGEFFVSRFADYRSADGAWRKYRIALIDGRPFAVHLAISSHWIVSYVNAGMADDAAKRREEAAFMAGFDEEFARRHAAAFREIHERLRLDYAVLDCGEMPDGRLLLFEVDTAALVHATDPVELYPYKQPAMRKLFDAFRELLESRRPPSSS
jgi:hypothetical protein